MPDGVTHPFGDSIPPGLGGPSGDPDTPRSLRALLAGDRAIITPGVTNALSARLVERAGFSACYVTGAGIANAEFGFPDVGLVTATEMANQVARISAATDLPVIVDADNGYGGPLSTMRTVSTLERLGVAAIQIEDQIVPKRCGHFEGKRVVDTEEMVTRLGAAITARSNPDLMIVARTDARASLGIEAALERCKRYAEIGADALFLEAPTSIDEIRMIPAILGTELPLVVNVVEGGKTPPMSVQDLEQLGYRLIIHANALLRVAILAMQKALRQLSLEPESTELRDSMVSWEERQSLVGLQDADKLEDWLETHN